MNHDSAPFGRAARAALAIFAGAALVAAASFAVDARATSGAPVEDQPLVARLLGDEIRGLGADELRATIVQRLAATLEADAGITATDAEIDRLLAAMEASRASHRAGLADQRDVLRNRAEDTSLAAAERDAAQAELGVVEQLLTNTAPEPETDAVRAQRRQFAAAAIRAWKINAELHRRHGGRIAYQQGGPEPIDAWRRFLEVRQAAGDFEILDPAIAQAFWAYWRDDPRHDFMPGGSEDEKRAFSTPPW